MHLHHYCSFDAIQNIKKGFIRLSTFNEPIITNHNIETNSTNKKRLSDKEFRSQMETQYQNLPSNLSAMISLEYFIEQSKSKRSQIETALYNETEKKQAIEFEQQVIESTAFLNLSQINNHYHLWQYEADHFKGIIISLNKDSICNGTYNKKKQLRLLKPINYTNDKDIIRSKENPLPGVFDNPKELQSEKAWRLAIAKKQCHSNPDNNYLMKLKKGDINSIIFGCYIDKALIKKTIEYFKRDLNLRNIEFKQLHTSNRHFELTVRPYK